MKQMFHVQICKMYVHVKKEIKVSYSLSSLCNLLRGQSMTNCHIGTNTNAFLLDTKKEKNPRKNLIAFNITIFSSLFARNSTFKLEFYY